MKYRKWSKIFSRTIMLTALTGSVAGATFMSIKFRPNHNEITLATLWNATGPQYKGLKKIVDKFNSENPSDKPIVIKSIDPSKVDTIAATGTIGERKLPNLYISYAEGVYRNSLMLKKNKSNLNVVNLKEHINKEYVDDVIDSFINEGFDESGFLYSAPIGKSVDLSFVNLAFMLEVFEKLGVNKVKVNSPEYNQGNLLDLSSIPEQLKKLNDINSMEAREWLQSKDPQTFRKIDLLKNDEVELKSYLKSWDNLIAISKATSILLSHSKINFNGTKQYYVLGIDDLGNSIFSQFANEGLLDKKDQQVLTDFIFSEEKIEGKQNEFIPTINITGKSKAVLQRYLTDLQSLKELSKRTSSNPERINGLRIKSGARDYNSNFFSRGDMLINFGSSAGMSYLANPKINLNSNWILPLPLPSHKEGVNRIMQQGPGISMFSSFDKEKDVMAKKFVEFLTRPDNNQVYAVATNYFPIHKKSYEEGEFADYLKPNPQDKDIDKNKKILMREITNKDNNYYSDFRSLSLTSQGSSFRFSILIPSLSNFVLNIKDGIWGEKPLTFVDVVEQMKIETSKIFSSIESKFKVD